MMWRAEFKISRAENMSLTVNRDEYVDHVTCVTHGDGNQAVG